MTPIWLQVAWRRRLVVGFAAIGMCIGFALAGLVFVFLFNPWEEPGPGDGIGVLALLPVFVAVVVGATGAVPSIARSRGWIQEGRKPQVEAGMFGESGR